jgi:hypothetical protein
VRPVDAAWSAWRAAECGEWGGLPDSAPPGGASYRGTLEGAPAELTVLHGPATVPPPAPGDESLARAVLCLPPAGGFAMYVRWFGADPPTLPSGRPLAYCEASAKEAAASQ